MTKPLLLLASLLISLGMSARNGYLCVWKSDGQMISIALNDKPVTTFSGDDLVLTTSDMVTRFSFSEVKKYTYEGLADGITNVYPEGTVISYANNKLTVSNVTKDAELLVYHANGTLVLKTTAKADGQKVVDFSVYKKGVYVVKFSGLTLKFQKL